MRRWVIVPATAVVPLASLVIACATAGQERSQEPPPEQSPPAPIFQSAPEPGPPVPTPQSLPAAALPHPEDTLYEVAPGDSLAAIAQRFDTTPARLVLLNDLSGPDAVIVPGQTLEVPVDLGDPIQPPDPLNTELQRVELERVIDGDTIEVRLADGTLETVRYLGLDAPAIVANEHAAALGARTRTANADLVVSDPLYIERDNTDRDPNGNLLRYLWVERGDTTFLLVNAALVVLGLAELHSLPPDLKYLQTLTAAQALARAASLGIWSSAPPAP